MPKLYRVQPNDEPDVVDSIDYSFDKWVCEDCLEDRNQTVIDTKFTETSEDVCEDCNFPELYVFDEEYMDDLALETEMEEDDGDADKILSRCYKEDEQCW